jgi:hypothetical protein
VPGKEKRSMKPNDIVSIVKGKEKLQVTRKAFEVIYAALGYKLEKEPVNADGDSDK